MRTTTPAFKRSSTGAGTGRCWGWVIELGWTSCLAWVRAVKQLLGNLGLGWVGAEPPVVPWETGASQGRQGEEEETETACGSPYCSRRQLTSRWGLSMEASQ